MKKFPKDKHNKKLSYKKEYGIASELGFEGTLMKLREVEELDNLIDPSHRNFCFK